jgi:putative oxidoreductase
MTGQKDSRPLRRQLLCGAFVAAFAAMKFLHLNFLPRSSDAALLLLRVWYGASLLLLHGWGKITGFSAMKSGFADPFGIGSTASLALAVFGEVVCSALLVLGLFTRVAALGAGITMAVAFSFAHGLRLTGQNNGELAFIYLGVFIALLLAGAGKFSVDAKLGAKV